MLALPHAEYDFAIWKGRRGVISPSFVPEGHGWYWVMSCLQDSLMTTMTESDSRLDSIPSGSSWRWHPGSLSTFRWNGKLRLPITDAAGVMVGYLMLDALVSNQDRHHENWGVILVPEQGIFFTPTFDHASSLGRNETDQTRTERLKTSDRGRSVEAYVERARSAFFATQTSPKPLKTLEAFQEAAKIRPVAADHWLSKLDEINTENFRAILGGGPSFGNFQPARDFALRMMEINAQRLLQAR